MAKKSDKQQQTVSTTRHRPPVVAVLGHVDHGKTTLLDTIRKTDLATREHGGITQRIGAYTVVIQTREGRKKITFIDTPGHEAFAKMRSRGAAVADIAVLVVSAVDGVMPQTREAIQHIKQANIPTIVAANKVDLPEANIDRVKQQLAKAGVVVEGYGGDTVVLPVSAKTGAGVPELLDMIILLSEMKESLMQDQVLSAVVIESKVDRNRGPVASVIIKTGTLHTGDSVWAGSVAGKIRAMISSLGEQLKEASPSEAVEILGFSSPLAVGSIVTSAPAREIAPALPAKDALTSAEGESEATIKLVIKSDSTGTLDAVKEVLPADVQIVLLGIGDITESDILFAKTTAAVVVGFGVNVRPAAKKLAFLEHVMVKTYAVIYELVKELAEVVEAIKAGKVKEVLGQGEILAEFPFDGERIAGVRVKQGRLAKGDIVAVTRAEEEIGQAKIKSIRQQKKELNKIETGQECGVHLIPALDFKIGDAIISYR